MSWTAAPAELVTTPMTPGYLGMGFLWASQKPMSRQPGFHTCLKARQRTVP